MRLNLDLSRIPYRVGAAPMPLGPGRLSRSGPSARSPLRKDKNIMTISRWNRYGGRRLKRALVGLAALMVMALGSKPALAGDCGFGYVWADRPSAPLSVPYTPSLPYQFNSSRMTNTVTRWRAGVYTVTFPKLDGAGGTVLVTAYGLGNASCKVAGWSSVGATTQVDLLVFSFSS